jgi:hypothetical protein
MTRDEIAETGVFLGLWLDEELVRAEFEAMIAAEWPAPEQSRTTSTGCRRQPGSNLPRRRTPLRRRIGGDHGGPGPGLRPGALTALRRRAVTAPTS